VTPVVLPAGLTSSVVTDGVQISGTPEHAGVSLIKVTATDANSNQGSKTFMLTINKADSTTTVTVANATYDGSPHGGTAAATGFGGLNQGLTVTYAGRNGTTYGPSTTAPTKVGDYTAAASFPGDADHNASSDSEDFSIAKAGQTITFAAPADKTFGVAPFAVSATGGPSGNPVTFAATGNCTSGGTNGATITITGAGSCTVTASQAGNSNYNAAADVARTFSINKAGATITLGNLSHTYDGTAKAATATTSPSGLSGVTITYTLNSVPVAAPTDAGSYQVTASLSNADYQATDATDTLVIGKAGQTITFAALANKTFGDADFAVVATASSGLTVSLAASGPCTVSGSNVHITGGGSCTVTASQAGNSNYNAAADVQRPFQVAKASQTITFGALADKTFGDADFAVSATSTSNLSVSFGAAGACTVVGTNVHITGAGSCTVTASQAGDSNYNAATNAPQSFNIAKAGSTTTVTAPDATYDGSPHGGTAAATGFGGLNQSRTVTYAGRNGTTYGPSTTAPTNAGDYTASASFPGDANHNTSNGSADFRILKAGQAITFAALSNRTFGDADFAVSATAGSGLGVSFTASGPCTVSGATVHLTGAGTCAVTASQAGNGNFNAAPNVERSFQIGKASQTITFGSLADRSFGDADFPLSAAATSGLGVNFGATGACSVIGTSLHITGAGSCTVTASQAGDTNYNPAADVQRSFTINKAGSTTTVTAPDATYDGSPHGGTAAATGFGGLNQGLTVTYAGRNGTVYGPSNTAPTNAGDYTASASFPGDANHNTSSGSADFRILKAGQAITFAALANKTFGDSDFDVSATAGSGLGVSFTAAGQCTISGATVHLTGAGSCTVTASQAGDNNNSAAPNVERSFQIAKGSTQTALSSSINPSDLGQHVTFTAAVTSAAGVPAGSVTFKDGAATLGTRTLDGAGGATFTTSALTAGVHAITVEYAGGSDHLASTGTLFDGQTVKGAPTLTVGDVTITEGDGGTKDAVFTVSLSAASGLGVSVN
ncbi:MAG TPA: MBG domain-containing protein, partial [Pyrinomonadaceae bacterium]